VQNCRYIDFGAKHTVNKSQSLALPLSPLPGIGVFAKGAQMFFIRISNPTSPVISKKLSQGFCLDKMAGNFF